MEPASLIALLFAYSLFATGPAAGTYQVVATNGAIIRADTRTGTFERCTLSGSLVTCKPIATAAK